MTEDWKQNCFVLSQVSWYEWDFDLVLYEFYWWKQQMRFIRRLSNDKITMVTQNHERFYDQAKMQANIRDGSHDHGKPGTTLATTLTC